MMQQQCKQKQCSWPLRSTAVAAVLAVGSVGAITGTVHAAPEADGSRYTAGAPGSGDPYFPYAGNGGYDVLHYNLALRYSPPADPAVLQGHLSGSATITLRATQDLESLNFDLRGLRVTSVRVDGKDVRHSTANGSSSGWAQIQDDANRIWELTIGLRPRQSRREHNCRRVRGGHGPAARLNRGALRVGHYRRRSNGR